MAASNSGECEGMDTRQSIIIDTDPGQDDAVAILLALASPELDVLGIVAVAGNVPLHLTSINVRKVLELARRTDVPVFDGAVRPMLRPLVTAEYVHGKTGLDGPDLPETKMAVEAPLGGGFFEGGNVTPAAEFNIYVDPHAAHLVFTSGIEIVMMPLDVTHKALTTRARVQRFRDAWTPVMVATAELLDFFERFDEEKYGTDGGPLHDPTVIAWVIRPELFSGRKCHVAVETASELTMGMTVVDWWRVTGKAPNATVMRDIDADGFFELLTTRLSTL